MNLDAQIQLLIDNAPQDSITPGIVAAIAPGLKLLAGKLSHSQYYILQRIEGDWVVTTLSHRANPNVEKRVIYAFPTLQDIPVSSVVGLDPQLVAVPIPVTHLLFQLFALETVDSIIFFETPGELTNGIEIQRTDIQNLIQQPSPNRLPPDIA